MDDRGCLKELTDLFNEMFPDETITFTREMRPADLAQWDSLSHITILVAVESRFGIKFKSSEFEGITNIGDFADLIDRKRNDAGSLNPTLAREPEGISDAVREFILGNFLAGSTTSLQDDERLLDSVIDSNGVLELVAFLEECFGISVADDELTATNLESIRKIVAYIVRKTATQQSVLVGG